MKRFLFLYGRMLLLLVPIVLAGCEEEITIELPESESKLVVEGYIEPDMPPYILLTRSIKYFSDFSNAAGNLFVHDAEISVSDGSKTVDLIEVDMANLPDTLVKLILDVFQYSINDTAGLSGINFSFYTSLEMFGEVGKEYHLDVRSGEEHLTATTTIPRLVVPDSLWVDMPLFEVENDSLRILNLLIEDPANEANFYRYFTKRNDEAFYPNRFISVVEDALIDGLAAVVPLERGESRNKELNMDEYGMFKLGDTVRVKFCTIDQPHYKFWSTFEIGLMNSGPFSNPLQVASNVEGGLGIWGGYGSVYMDIVIE